MILRYWKITAVGAATALAVVACKTTQPPAPNAAGDTTAGSAATAGAGGSTGGAGGASIPTLVSVNLQNVLNDLSVSLKVNRDNIPVNAQVPIGVAASVCGVSVSALAASIASGQAGCTATSTTPELTQAVQQQIASGGSVTGGDQTMGATNNQM
jgi:hypothetical protein